jgi:hypothetical protein
MDTALAFLKSATSPSWIFHRGLRLPRFCLVMQQLLQMFGQHLPVCVFVPRAQPPDICIPGPTGRISYNASPYAEQRLSGLNREVCLCQDEALRRLMAELAGVWPEGSLDAHCSSEKNCNWIVCERIRIISSCVGDAPRR